MRLIALLKRNGLRPTVAQSLVSRSEADRRVRRFRRNIPIGMFSRPWSTWKRSAPVPPEVWPAHASLAFTYQALNASRAAASVTSISVAPCAADTKPAS